MRVLVTVGATTDFDSLVDAILAEDCLRAFSQRNYRTLSIQVGSSRRYHERVYEEQSGITIDLWRMKPSLKEEINAADLVISHAGSGTILDVLRLRKPLIVVPNSTLLHNHQCELAEALEKQGYLIATTASELSKMIIRLDPEKLLTFPNFDGSKFSSLLDGIVAS